MKDEAGYIRRLRLQGGITTYKKPPTGTSKCIRCFKPAMLWSGHVLKFDTGNQRKIVAGWCSERCQMVGGFRGQWTRRMKGDDEL